MARVLFAITDDTYVRNYLRSDALTALRHEHEVFIIADRALALAEEVKDTPGFHGFYELDDGMERIHHFLFNLMMWRYRKKSRTFFYRWLRNSNWHLIRRDGSAHVRLLSYIHWFGAALINPRGLRIPLLANQFSFPLVSAVVKSSLKTNQSLRALVEDNGIDVILFPSAAFDSVSVDLVSLGQELKIPTVCVIDNWDNLSSKTVFWKKPDYLGVWGPQTSEQAVRIHGFAPDRVHMIGTPRFEEYFSARESPSLSPFQYPYGLYVGSAMPFDDIGALEALDAILCSSKAFQPEFRLVYRPHPWQQKRNSPTNFREEDFSRVVLDKQLKIASQNALGPEKAPGAFQPDLNYYPGLLLNSSFVVGPLTTMLLEATLCLRPVIALTYFDGFHKHTSKRYFSHFDGMEQVPGFRFCTDKSEMGAFLEEALGPPVTSKEECTRHTSFFLLQDNRSYGERLSEFVLRVLQDKQDDKTKVVG